eukprot:scaffold3664_cov150-Skeletonema_menzelii.AAC.6
MPTPSLFRTQSHRASSSKKRQHIASATSSNKSVVKVRVGVLPAAAALLVRYYYSAFSFIITTNKLFLSIQLCSRSHIHCQRNTSLPAAL